MIEASKDHRHFRTLLEKEAGFFIDAMGQVLAFVSTKIESTCEEMDFSTYPRDKHKCEFVIHSLTHKRVSKILGLKTQFHKHKNCPSGVSSHNYV